MEMWLSNDEINVGAEEDVFKIILAWIDHDRYKRQKYFAELFGHVRVVFVSRDFLSNDILKNDLVKDNECCLNRVVDAINLIDSHKYDNLSIAPRKSLETSVMVVTSAVTPNNSCKQNGQPILCYFPGEGRWCKLGEMPRNYPEKGGLIFCRGKLHSLQHRSLDTLGFASYDLYSNSVSVSGLPDIDFAMVLEEIFVVNDDEIYALACGRRDVDYRVRQDVRSEERKKCISSIIKHKQASNSWEEVTSFDHLDARKNVCIVAKDDFVYFIGGEEWIAAETVEYDELTLYTDVYRYNINRNQWDKVADIQRPKVGLSGAACNGRIFITGKVELEYRLVTCQCEVYSETTNEWQFIASLNIRPGEYPKLLSVDEQLYALGCRMFYRPASPLDTRVECYDPDKNEWIWKTDIPIRMRSNTTRAVNAYSARIFKGFLSNKQLKSINSGRYFHPALSTKVREGKCVIV